MKALGGALVLLLIANLLAADPPKPGRKPCDVKKEWEQLMKDLKAISEDPAFPKPAVPKPPKRSEEYAREASKQLGELASSDAVEAARTRLPEAKKELSDIFSSTVASAKHMNPYNKVDGIEAQLSALRARIKALGGDAAAKRVREAAANQKASEAGLDAMQPSLTVSYAKAVIARSEVIRTDSVVAAEADLARGKDDALPPSAIAALQQKLDAAAEAARQDAKKLVDDWDAQAAVIKSNDPDGQLLPAAQQQARLNDDLAAAKQELAGSPTPAALDPVKAASDRTTLIDEIGRLEKLIAAQDKWNLARKNQKDAEACEVHEEAQAMYRKGREEQRGLGEEMRGHDEKVATLVADAKPNVNDLHDRITNPSKVDAKFKADGFEVALKNDKVKEKIAEARAGGVKPRDYQPYKDTAKRVVYNYVKQQERDQLIKAADELSDYDCWPEAAAWSKKLEAASKDPILNLESVAIGIDPRDLVDPSRIPDFYIPPLDDEPAVIKPSGKPIWVLQKAEIQAGANAVATESSVTVKNLPDAPQGPGSATITFTTPPATIMDGDTMTLTIRASAAGKGWGMGWYNIGCARQWINKEAMAASWPEGNRTTKTYNISTAVFTFGGSSKPYINLQAGQESGSSRWASVTWVYKKQETKP